MKDGAPTISTDGTGLRVAVVAASWHDMVMDGLLDGARRGLADAAVTHVDVVRVPGTFELPVACATVGITDVSVRTGTPIGFGVLTCDDEAQALDRAGLPGSAEDKGHEAASAAVATVVALRGVATT